MLKKRVVFCGGGTGGHIFPNLALIPEIKAFREVIYIGKEGGMEEKLAGEAGVEFFGLNPPKLIRSATPKNLKLPFALSACVAKAKEVLREVKPSVIFSKGGYVSLPVCLAGLSQNIPVLCHESDFSVGLANKISHLRGGVLLTAFPETYAGKKRVLHVGTPIRKEVLEEVDSNLGFGREMGLCATERKVLLVLGGSQGAEKINLAVLANLQKLTAIFEVLHITGRGKSILARDIERQFANLSHGEVLEMKNHYTQVEFCEDMARAYGICDLAVSRGGANALFELLEREIPTTVIPLCKGSRGDQVENATYFSKKGMCQMLAEENIFGFFESICSLDASREKIKGKIAREKLCTMLDGREEIARLILSY